ncbi:MAG: cation-translocating P-type ATPase [Patescibacteria group bacterium]
MPINIRKYHPYRLLYIVAVVGFFLFSFTQPDHIFRLLTFLLAWAPVAWEALKSLKEKKFGSELFFVLAAVIALIGDEELAMTVVLLVVLVAEYFEELVEERTERAIESLLKLVPDTVLVQQDNEEKLLPISEVRIGMRVVVKTGTSIPVDGRVAHGKAEVNEASLTGESAVKTKRAGDPVFSGTFVENGSVIVETEKVGENTMFGRIRRLMEDAEKRKAGIQILADKVAYILTPLLILFIGAVWLFTKDIKLVITFLVFGSPIELALVTPLAILAGTVSAFRRGVIVKGGLALERFAKVDTLILDKTGTLTIGEPKVISVQTIDAEHSDKDVIRMAAIAEKRSGHVLASAVLAKAKEEGITVPEPDYYEYIPGHGATVRYQNQNIRLGSKHYIEAKDHGNVKVGAMLECADEDALHSSFYLACGEKLCGMICVADELRGDAVSTIEHFKEGGMKNIILLSGDRDEVAKRVANKLGISEAYGGVLPDAKLKKIQELQKQGHRVAMIGDGVNDAPALKAADVGIAMGAMGMEPAIEASDIALMSNDLSKVVSVHEISRRVIRTIKQNIILGLGLTHGLGMALAFLHVLNPIQAAFFHAVPDLLILYNSGRLIR